MFVLRAAGATLLIYALFNAAFGLNRQELPWLMSAVLLTIGGFALLLLTRVAAVEPGKARRRRDA